LDISRSSQQQEKNRKFEVISQMLDVVFKEKSTVSKGTESLPKKASERAIFWPVTLLLLG